MLGSGGLGGDEVPRVGVHVVEVGVVMVVVVGVVRRHLLDAGGDAPHRLDAGLRGRPAPGPPPSALPSLRGSPAPMILWGILRPKPHLRYRTGSATAHWI